MQKWLSIQALRGIAVLGVVAFHCLFIDKKYFGPAIALPDVFQLGQSGVDLFFVISGFVMVTVTRGRFGSRKEVLRFVWGRVTRIYPTYWVYFFLTLAVFLLRPNLVNASTGHQARMLSSFLLLPSDQLPLVMVGWSLIHELWFYCVFALLLLGKENMLPHALLAWAASIVAANLLLPVETFSATIRLAMHPYTLEFIIGAGAALYLHGNHAKQAPLAIAGCAIGLALLAGLPLAYHFNVLENADLLRAGVMGCTYGLLALALPLLEMSGKLPMPRPLSFMGDISYTVYLSHTLVLSALGRLWYALKPATDSLALDGLAWFILLSSVVAYGWLGYRFIELPIMKQAHRFRARWLGSR